MIYHVVTDPDIFVAAPRFYFSELQEAPTRTRSEWTWSMKTPSGQRVTRIEAPGRRLYVYTRSRVYYLRRKKLVLWRLL